LTDSFLGYLRGVNLDIRLNTNASEEAMNFLVDALRYENMSIGQDLSPRTLEISLSNGRGSTAIRTKEIRLFAIHEEPDIDLASSDLSYVSGVGKIQVHSEAVFTAEENTQFNAAKLIVQMVEWMEIHHL